MAGPELENADERACARQELCHCTGGLIRNPDVLTVERNLSGVCTGASNRIGSQDRPGARQQLRDGAVISVRHPDIRAVERHSEWVQAHGEGTKHRAVTRPNLANAAGGNIAVGIGNPEVCAVERQSFGIRSAGRPGGNAPTTAPVVACSSVSVLLRSLETQICAPSYATARGSEFAGIAIGVTLRVDVLFQARR